MPSGQEPCEVSGSGQKCEITWADGFKTTENDSCEDALTTALARQHGGSCRGEERYRSVFE